MPFFMQMAYAEVIGKLRPRFRNSSFNRRKSSIAAFGNSAFSVIQIVLQFSQTVLGPRLRNQSWDWLFNAVPKRIVRTCILTGVYLKSFQRIQITCGFLVVLIFLAFCGSIHLPLDKLLPLLRWM